MGVACGGTIPIFLRDLWRHAVNTAAAIATWILPLQESLTFSGKSLASKWKQKDQILLLSRPTMASKAEDFESDD